MVPALTWKTTTGAATLPPSLHVPGHHILENLIRLGRRSAVRLGSRLGVLMPPAPRAQGRPHQLRHPRHNHRHDRQWQQRQHHHCRDAAAAASDSQDADEPWRQVHRYVGQ